MKSYRFFFFKLNWIFLIFWWGSENQAAQNNENIIWKCKYELKISRIIGNYPHSTTPWDSILIYLPKHLKFKMIWWHTCIRKKENTVHMLQITPKMFSKIGEIMHFTCRGSPVEKPCSTTNPVVPNRGAANFLNYLIFISMKLAKGAAKFFILSRGAMSQNRLGNTVLTC
jgi:hypothetical protein